MNETIRRIFRRRPCAYCGNTGTVGGGRCPVCSLPESDYDDEQDENALAALYPGSMALRIARREAETPPGPPRHT